MELYCIVGISFCFYVCVCCVCGSLARFIWQRTEKKEHKSRNESWKLAAISGLKELLLLFVVVVAAAAAAAAAAGALTFKCLQQRQVGGVEGGRWREGGRIRGRGGIN